MTDSAIKEKPILFSGPMVKAILAGKRRLGVSSIRSQVIMEFVLTSLIGMAQTSPARMQEVAR